jgi:hypothetical protein
MEERTPVSESVFSSDVAHRSLRELASSLSEAEFAEIVRLRDRPLNSAVSPIPLSLSPPRITEKDCVIRGNGWNAEVPTVEPQQKKITWKPVPSPEAYKILTYNDFMHLYFDEKSKLHYAAIYERINDILKQTGRTEQGIGQAEVGHIVFERLFGESRRKLYEYWKSNRVNAQDSEKIMVTEDEFNNFFALTFLFRLMKFSVEKSTKYIEKKFEAEGLREVQNIEKFRHILKYLIPFDTTYSTTSNATYDDSTKMNDFMKALFQPSARLFISSDTLLVIDDELIASSSKTLDKKFTGQRKAGKNGGKTDVIATALDRCVAAVLPQGENYSQKAVVKDLMKYICASSELGLQQTSQTKAEITADRGYPEDALIESSQETGIGAISILKSKTRRLTPFATLSELKAAEEKMRSSTANNPTPVQYPQEQFIIDDNIQLGPAIVAAKAVSSSRGKGNAKSLYAFAVRPVVTKKNTGTTTVTGGRAKEGVDTETWTTKSKNANPFVLKFVSTIDSNDMFLDTWVAQPNPWPRNKNKAEYLFMKEHSKDALKAALEEAINLICVILTKVQRTADWMLTKKGVISATFAGKLAIYSRLSRQFLQPDGSVPEKPTPAALFQRITNNWFQVKLSTAYMKKGSANEENVIRNMKERTYVKRLYETGLIKRKGTPFACSPDGIALLDLPDSILDGLNPRRLSGYVFASVEIKSKIATDLVRECRQVANKIRMSPKLAAIRGDLLLITKVGTDEYFNVIPRCYRGQVMHQMYVLKSNACLFIVAATGSTGGQLCEILYTVLVLCTDDQLHQWKSGLDNVLGDLLKVYVNPSPNPDWSYLEKNSNQEDLEEAKTNYKFLFAYHEMVKNGTSFDSGVKRYLSAIVQYYDILKGGLDGNSNYTAQLQSERFSLSWNQKIVLHSVNQILANAFVASRIFLAWRQLKQVGKQYTGLIKFRNLQNKLSCIFPDFIDDVCKIMLSCHVREDADNSSISNFDAENEVFTQLRRLKQELPTRNRFKWFNSKGKALRLSCGQEFRHNPVWLESLKTLKCILCGNNTRTLCETCRVPLHVNATQSARKSCWNKFHQNDQLKKSNEKEKNKRTSPHEEVITPVTKKTRK